MEQKITVKGTKVFNREQLKKIFFGKGDDNAWYLKTVFLDRDSLSITIVRSSITEDTMRVITSLYLGADVNSPFVDNLREILANSETGYGLVIRCN